MHHRTVASIFLVLLATGVRGGDAPAAPPAWLAGSWCGQDGPARSEESWLAPAGGQMLGMSRTVAPGRSTQFEFLRIDSVDGVLSYLAQPGGAAVTAFARTDGGERWIRFENPTHDFPRSVEYRRDGDTLKAEIAGPGKNGETMRIAYLFERCRRAP